MVWDAIFDVALSEFFGWRWCLYLLLLGGGVIALYQLPAPTWLFWTLAAVYFAGLTTGWARYVGWSSGH